MSASDNYYYYYYYYCCCCCCCCYLTFRHQADTLQLTSLCINKSTDLKSYIEEIFWFMSFILVTITGKLSKLRVYIELKYPSSL